VQELCFLWLRQCKSVPGGIFLSFKMAGNAFIGTWNLESSDNFDAYMKAVGVGMIMAKMASTAKPKMTISVSDDGTWTLKSETTFKTTKVEFKLGVEFEETTADDRKMKTTITLDGNTLTQDQKGETPSTIIREVDATGTKMLITCKAKDVVATRHYVKAQ